MNPSCHIDVSVIIVSYNTLSYLQRSIASVAEGFRKYTAEVVVVDNNSQDGSREWLQTQPHIRSILNATNTGFAVANNQAIEVRRGRHCLLLNSDAFMHPGCGDRLVAFLESHPKAGLAVPTFEYENGVWQQSFGYFPSLWRMLSTLVGWQSLTHVYYRWRDKYYPLSQPSRQDYGEGAGLLIRDEVIRGLGGLSPDYFFYAEDIDYNLRATRAGWQTWWVPTARLTHVRGASLARKDTALGAERKLRGLVKFTHHYYSPVEARAVFFLQYLHLQKLVYLAEVAAKLPGFKYHAASRLPLYRVNRNLYRKSISHPKYKTLVEQVLAYKA
ncbi:MAG: hypothetical protein RLZZ387_3543 [Chloroflexota bacterium]|jgi:GT2 family glycosyltransferase